MKIPRSCEYVRCEWQAGVAHVSGRLTLGSKGVKSTSDYVRHTVELPRPTKRIISIIYGCGHDAAGALGRHQSQSRRYRILTLTDWPAYVAVVAVSIPIFVRLGSVPRSHSLSRPPGRLCGGLCGRPERRLAGHPGHGVRYPGALVERGDDLLLSRAALRRGFALRGALLPADPLHSADRGAGRDLRRGRCRCQAVDRVVDHARVRSAGLHRRQPEPAWSHGQRHQGLRTGAIAGADQGPRASIASCWRCPRSPAGAGARS